MASAGDWLRRVILLLVFLIVVGVSWGGEVWGQELGRSGVAGDLMSEQAGEGGLTYYYPRRFEPAVRRLMAREGSLLSSLEERLGLEELRDIEVWVLPDLAMYFELHEAQYRPEPWAVGLSLSDRSTILVKHGVSAGGEIVDIEATFAHELVHVAVDRARAGQRVPRWFNEGLAVLYAEQWSPERSEVLSKAGSTGSLIPFSALDHNFPPHHMTVSLAYSQSFHFVRWIEQRHGPEVFAESFRTLREGQSFETAFEEVSGESLEQMEVLWRREVKENSSFWAILGDETAIFFGAALLLLLGFVQTLRRRRAASLAAGDEEDGVTVYDPARYPLPGQS